MLDRDEVALWKHITITTVCWFLFYFVFPSQSFAAFSFPPFTINLVYFSGVRISFSFLCFLLMFHFVSSDPLCPFYFVIFGSPADTGQSPISLMVILPPSGSCCSLVFLGSPKHDGQSYFVTQKMISCCFNFLTNGWIVQCVFGPLIWDLTELNLSHSLNWECILQSQQKE